MRANIWKVSVYLAWVLVGIHLLYELPILALLVLAEHIFKLRNLVLLGIIPLAFLYAFSLCISWKYIVHGVEERLGR